MYFLDDQVRAVVSTALFSLGLAIRPWLMLVWKKPWLLPSVPLSPCAQIAVECSQDGVAWRCWDRRCREQLVLPHGRQIDSWPVDRFSLCRVSTVV